MRENGKKLDPQEADAWSAEEVIRRSIIAYRPKTLRGEEIEINQAWADFHAKPRIRDNHSIHPTRQRHWGWSLAKLRFRIWKCSQDRGPDRGSVPYECTAQRVFIRRHRSSRIRFEPRRNDCFRSFRVQMSTRREQIEAARCIT